MGKTAEVYQIQVQGVQNTDIFSAFTRGTTGVPSRFPSNFNDNGATIAGVDTIKAMLSLRSPVHGSQNAAYIRRTTLVMTAKLNNCSQAADSRP